MRNVLLITATILGASVGFAASNGERSDCIDESREPSSRIPACTRIIESLGEPELERAAAYLARAALNFRIGNYDAAIYDYSELIRLNPKFGNAYHGRGLSYYAAADYKKAIADYTQAILLNPNYVAAYNNRGITFAKIKSYEQAISDYDQAIRIDSTYANAYYNRGIVRAAIASFDLAIRDFEHALRIEPNSPATHNEMAWTYLKMGYALKGLMFADRALQLNPRNANAYDTRATINEALGRKADALADFQSSLSLDPSHQSSKDGLKRLSP